MAKPNDALIASAMHEHARVSAISYALAGQDGAVSLAAGEDKDAQRKDLLARLRAGEPIELVITAETYAQGEGVRNVNNVEMSNAALAGLAKTASNTPFQRDHSLATEDNGGFVVKSKVENRDGVRVLVEDIRLSARWAVEAVLEERMRAFSISWRAMSLDDVMCSQCNAGIAKCNHYPGDRYAAKNGEELITRFVYKSAEWRERSWVINPAVRNVTGTRDWAQLAELREARNPSEKTEHNKMDKIAKLLGLNEDASAENVAAKVHDLVVAQETLAARVDDLTEELKDRNEVADKLKAAEEKLAAVETAKLSAEADSEIERLVKDGRLRAGGKQEALVRKLYSTSPELAREQVAALAEEERIAPVGPRQSNPAHQAGGQPTDPTSGAGEPAPFNFRAAFASLPEHVRLAAGSHAKNPETFIKANRATLAEMGLSIPDHV